MLKNRTALFVLAIILFSTAANAQIRKYSNEFLNIGAGARALGMAGAQTGHINDVYAGYWNPAGLVNINGTYTGALMHSEYFAGIAKYDFGAVSLPLADGDRRLGISVIRFGVDDIPNTLFLKNPDGSINYDNVTSFSVANYAFIASYAMKTGIDGLSWGANAKVIHNKAGSFANSWGLGLDAGLQYYTDTWRAGAMVKDITTTYNAWSFNFTDDEQKVLQETGNVIPKTSTELTAPSIMLGGAYNLEVGEKFSILPALDLVLTTDGKRNVLLAAKPISLDARLGVEAAYAKTIFLRAGVGNFQRATSDVTGKDIFMVQPNIGVGLKIKAVSIDYALTNLGSLSGSQSLYSHVFSLKLELGQEDY